MNLLRRFGFFISGFSIGLIILAVFLRGKKTSCDYGPNARTIKSVLSKQKVYSETAKLSLNQFEIDTISKNSLIATGDVNFSKSKTNLDSCNIYYIENKLNNKPISIKVRNCDKIVYVVELLH